MRTQPADRELAMLPQLPQLIDPEQARMLLEASMRSGENPDYRELRIQSCQPRVARYKPGSRCTVLYQLEYAAEPPARHEWPQVVVAKTYHGDKGQNAYAGMQALWRSPLGASATVRIAEPLAWLPQLNVLVQGPIREELTLKELLRREPGSGGQAAKEGELSKSRLNSPAISARRQPGWRNSIAAAWLTASTSPGKMSWRRSMRSAPWWPGPLPQLANLAEELLNHLRTLAAAPAGRSAGAGAPQLPAGPGTAGGG